MVVDSYPFSPKTGWQEAKMTSAAKNIKAIEFAGWRVGMMVVWSDFDYGKVKVN
jgi:hypothetical protein